MSKYRIIRRYHSFFNHWHYTLEKLTVTKFLWWRFERWEKVAGNSLTTTIPSSWSEFEIEKIISENP